MSSNMVRNARTVILTRGQPPRRRRYLPRLSAHTIKDVAGKLKERHSDLLMSPDQSQEIVQDVLDIVQDYLLNGDDVMLQGFGKFSAKEIAAREYRNPRTGEKVLKDKCVRPQFRPALALKRTLNERFQDETD